MTTYKAKFATELKCYMLIGLIMHMIINGSCLITTFNIHALSVKVICHREITVFLQIFTYMTLALGYFNAKAF
jgi:hypothetical protein